MRDHGLSIEMKLTSPPRKRGSTSATLDSRFRGNDMGFC
jgi:hypothetical protein